MTCGEMPGTLELARRLGCGPIVWRFQNGVSIGPFRFGHFGVGGHREPVMNILKLVLLSLLRLTSFGIIKAALFICIWSLPEPIAPRVDGRTSFPASDGAQEAGVSAL